MAGDQAIESVGGLGSESAKINARKAEKKVPAAKRRCIGSACIACKRRKSKCDGALPACAACTAVYGATCEYDLASDHRRKGVYKKDNDSKPRVDTVHTLIEAILNLPEDEAFDLVRRIRTCENLEDVASQVNDDLARIKNEPNEDDAVVVDSESASTYIERDLATHIGHMRLGDGTMQFLGGTSNLRYAQLLRSDMIDGLDTDGPQYAQNEDIVRSWTTVTKDVDLILHLLQLYFTWHYPYFTTLSKSLFFRDFFRGRPLNPSSPEVAGHIEYCSPLLVNAMLALGCHFTSWPRARSDLSNPSTAGAHFFKEAKRLIVENGEFENPRLVTVQALALMSVREAGCGREAKGWVYSGMSFRMACDLGLNVKLNLDGNHANMSDEDRDARRMTFWGCYHFDKCWSNYLGRPPQLVNSNISVPKFEVFPEEEAELWSPRTDDGVDKTHSQPSRTRTVAMQINALSEISGDLMLAFYSPTQPEKAPNKAAEVKRLSDFHTKLEVWLKDLPKELQAKEGQLPPVLLMHMFFHLLYIHLFRPFLKYTKASSPLPPNVSPRKLCTQAALKISKLLRLYKKTYGLKQICNIAVYIAHSACSIHLLNLPDKDAKRDLGYGIRHLEEIAECWPCASRTLATLAVQVRRWQIELPEDMSGILERWENRYKADHASPMPNRDSPGHLNLRDPPSPTSKSSFAAQMFAQIAPRSDPTTSFAAPTSNSLSMSTGQPFPGYGQAASSFTTSPTQAPQAWTQARPGIPSSQKRPSPAQLYGGVDALFEENKEWWYRDQSTYFDNWSRRDSVGMNSGNIDDISGAMDANVAAQINFMGNNPQLNILSDWSPDVNAFGYNAQSSSSQPTQNGF